MKSESLRRIRDKEKRKRRRRAEKLVMRGWSVSRIASKMALSVKTVYAVLEGTR